MANRNLRWWVVATGALALGATVIPIAGQQPGTGQDVLSALLIEVRGLRAAMEQMSATGARVQLAMGRLQLQEQRITTMIRRLDGVREQRVAAEREGNELRQRIAQLEEMTERGENPEERKMAAAESRALKSMVEQRSTDLQRLISEETEVSSAIAAEQSRWSDINKTLEDLERALTRR